MRDELEVKVTRHGEPLKIPDEIAHISPGVFAGENGPAPFMHHERMILNPNKDIVLKVIERIYKCEGKCPCQPQDPSTDTRCPCSDFTKYGNCHCKLFVPAE